MLLAPNAIIIKRQHLKQRLTYSEYPLVMQQENDDQFHVVANQLLHVGDYLAQNDVVVHEHL